MTQRSADQLPIECLPWEITICDATQKADAYTEDGRMVFEQWDAQEARYAVADHNDQLEQTRRVL